MQCQQPGCSGEIVDGYCDVCGTPGAGGATTSVPSVGPAAIPAGRPTSTVAVPSAANGTPCRQPACNGTVVDGYCDVCGTPASGGDYVEAASRASAASAGAPAGVDGAGSVATSSMRLDSAALGSRRATGVTRQIRTGSTRTRAARLGAGLTTVPPAPAVDPAAVVKTNPQVPEDKRSCPKCGSPVGRSVDGRPGRPEGFCATCGTAYSYTPKLKAGDLVAGQYLVAGALAHGGLGWIYLARDRNVSDRWVVLKGLLNSGDPDALAAAIAEQRFLAQVEHPLIVEIYNFVTHDNAGYIVMEYVGGTSLKDVLKDRMRVKGSYDPLPVDQALAYVIEVLPAFQYLHDLGLVYCDFKPDNLIQVGDAVKLIDLGGVRRIDDEDSAIYGTVGYQAPEVAHVGPTVASDIYTIGRTLLVLCMEFRGYQSTYLHSLPDPATTPLFQQYDSLYWLLAKCCATDPADRFVSADELRSQALGVLREVVALRTRGTSLTSAASVHFASPAVSTARVEWSQLPSLISDPGDPQHSWLSSLAPGEPHERLAALQKAPGESPEVWLAIGHESLLGGNTKDAVDASNVMLKEDPWEWRALWLAGLASLAQGDWNAAQSAFNAVYQQVPGELAPKLALAIACEGGGQLGVAESLYDVCAQTDAAYVAPAAFGLARCRAAAGDVQGAVAALDYVPTTSRGYGDSRRLRAQLLMDSAKGDIGKLDQAIRSVDGIRMDVAEREDFRSQVLERALAVITKGGALTSPKERIGDVRATEHDIRAALERSYRSLARETQDKVARIELVDKANATRPWSMT